MQCPKCNGMETKVIDSRVVDEGAAIRRRRECEYCQHRFTTFERRGFADLLVVKKDGSKEIYDRSKIKKAILLSFAKREITSEHVEQMINNLEANRSNQGSQISSIQIGDDVLALIKETDPVAYVRFASVYKSFDSLEDFQRLI